MKLVKKLTSLRKREVAADRSATKLDEKLRGSGKPKLPFIKPKLVSHGHMVDVTAQFGGTITPP